MKITLSLDLVTPYNQCVRHTSYGAYASKGYKIWLDEMHALVLHEMGVQGVERLTEGNIRVSIGMHLEIGRRCDVDAVHKQVLDMLAGSIPNEKGKIVNEPLLIANDRLAVDLRVAIRSVGNPKGTGRIMVVVDDDGTPPIDVAARNKAAEREARQAARAVKRTPRRSTCQSSKAI